MAQHQSCSGLAAAAIPAAVVQKWPAVEELAGGPLSYGHAVACSRSPQGRSRNRIHPIEANTC
jgi:hypothetical protein